MRKLHGREPYEPVPPEPDPDGPVEAIWSAPFPTRYNGRSLQPGERAVVTRAALASEHWQQAP